MGEQGQDTDQGEESGHDGGKAVEQEAEAQQPEGGAQLEQDEGADGQDDHDLGAHRYTRGATGHGPRLLRWLAATLRV